MSEEQQENNPDASVPARGRDAVGASARPQTKRLFSRRAAQSPREALQPDSAPPPPPPTGRKKRPGLEAFSGFLTFLLILGVISGFGLVLANHNLKQPGPLASDKVVLIAQGADVPDIIEQLQTQGVIESPALFNLALFVEGNRSKLKAGEYQFKQNASLQDVIDTMVQGKSILHMITIPEGLTSQQIVDRLRDDEVLAGDVHETPREGSLLPETYKFQRGASRDQLLQKMARDQKQLLDEIWKRRSADLPITSPYEMVTLASIVEKETGKADERPRVAGVFINRLRKHMRLQSDPTIVYGIVGGQGALGRPLSRAEIDKPTAYNTYQIDGLPPGPIANPGRAALEAVANPSRTRELYFVADGTGGHVFADSLDSHNRNVQHWRQIEQTAKPKPAAPGVDPSAPGAPVKDEHGELTSPHFGAAPTSIEFEARRDAANVIKPRLKTDPRLMALVNPTLPDAPDSPRRVTDRPLNLPKAEPVLANADNGLSDAAIGGATQAENELDGPAVADDNTAVNPATYPLSPAMKADMRARAARYGNAANLDGPAPPVEASALDAKPPMAYANMAPNGRPKILDASEGTALDPLLDKSWDLNSPKAVPALPKAGAQK
jgi:UPF0755 protein